MILGMNFKIPITINMNIATLVTTIVRNKGETRMQYDVEPMVNIVWMRISSKMVESGDSG
jgi:hypothetical protein